MSSIMDAVDEQKLDLAAQRLAGRLARFSRGQLTLTKNVVRDVMDCVKQHRRDCWNNHGVKFPELVAVILPSVGQIKLYRAEQDPHSIQSIVVNVATEFPQVPMQELVQAIGLAFPDFAAKRFNFSPSQLINKGH